MRYKQIMGYRGTSVTKGTRRVREARGTIRGGRKMYKGYKRYNKGVEPPSVLLSYLLYMRYARVH